MKIVKLATLAALTTFAVSPAFAASKLVAACKSDLKKAGCKAKTDKDAHECLEKHEERGKPNEGFTKACYDAHEAFEKASGKEEHEEHHE